MKVAREQDILDAIQSIILAEGFAHLTVGKLATRLSCSRRALYEIEPSKEALITRVVKGIFIRRLEATKALVYALPAPLERLMAFLEEIRHRNDERTEVFLRDVIALPVTREVRTAHVRLMLDVLEGILRDGISRGIFREQNPGLTTALAFGLMQTIANPGLARELGADYPTLFAGTIEFFLHGVIVNDARDC